MKSKLKNRARQLRKASTPHESVLWAKLRSRRFTGFKFKRQQPLSDYIVDFICLERRLIIELDGSQHGYDDNRARDTRRDHWLRSQGFAVLRVSNYELKTNTDGVLQTIWSVLHGKGC